MCVFLYFVCLCLVPVCGMCSVQCVHLCVCLYVCVCVCVGGGGGGGGGGVCVEQEAGIHRTCVGGKWV